MFDFLKRAQSSSNQVAAPVKGTCISIEEVPDPVFSAKMMGDGFAVIPAGDEVVAPVDGEIEMLPSSRHAFGMKTKSGVEILVHIGLDTVKLEGRGFTALQKQGSRVKAGTPVIRVDRKWMEEKGINLTTMLVFTAGYEKEVDLPCFGKEVEAGEAVLSLS